MPGLKCLPCAFDVLYGTGSGCDITGGHFALVLWKTFNHRTLFMKSFREFIGYLSGGILFVVLIPFIMWLVSGRPELWPVALACAIAGAILIVGGLILSIYTIIYMRRRGKGNPMDAFGHEVAPRTQHLMSDGPYRINRNPMLSGTLIYLAGAAIWIWHWQAWVVWVVFFAIMFVQVISEERRLERDFGEEYLDYCKRTRRF